MRKIGGTSLTLVLAALIPLGQNPPIPKVGSEVSCVVTDDTGALIPKAKVVFQSGTREVTTHTDANGAIHVKLDPGTYVVTAKAQGFAEKKVPEFLVQASEPGVLKIALSVEPTDSGGMARVSAEVEVETVELPEMLLPLRLTSVELARMAKAQAYEAKGFHPLDCFAGQVRIRGKRLSRQSFTVFRPSGDTKCCGEKVGVGRTDTHGHFLSEPLSEGEYFAVFDGKATQYTVSFAVVQSYQRCDGTHVELNFSAANKCSLQTYADADYDEKDCLEDDPACYRK